MHKEMYDTLCIPSPRKVKRRQGNASVSLWGRGGVGTATHRLKLGVFRYQAFNEMNLIFSALFFLDYVRDV